MPKANLNQYLLYLLLWIGYFLLQYYFLSFPFDSGAAMVLAMRVVLIHAALFYINSLLLLPRLLDTTKYLHYFLAVAGLVVATFFIFNLTNDLPVVQEALETGRQRFGRGMSGFRSFRSRFFTNNMLASLAVLFLSTVYWIIRRERKRKQQELDQEHESLQSEMRFLKSQINPHFLLNALNNIYSMASLKSSKTPELILRLSEMLKYVLYEENTKTVTLEREISYIEDYISFQKLKFEKEPHIEIDFSNADKKAVLAPMLLIPFIENSFKHSNLDDDKGYVKLEISTSGKVIILKVENSKGGSAKDKTGGIGLENVRRRLNLLYPERHLLYIDDEEDKFLVELILRNP